MTPSDMELILNHHFSTTLKINITKHITSELSTENNLQESLLHLLLVSLCLSANWLCVQGDFAHCQDACVKKTAAAEVF